MHFIVTAFLLSSNPAALTQPTALLDDVSVQAYWQPEHSPVPKLSAQFFKPGLKARMIIEFRIEQTGHVTDVRLIEKQPADIEEAPFLEAVAARTYQPSEQNEERFSVTVHTEVTFGGIAQPTER